MRNKRIFVSGGAGVIGTALVNFLLKEGADVFVGDLKPCPREWLGKVRYRQGDLNTIAPENLLAFDPEIFFHLAATFERSEESFPFFAENFHHNIQLSHYLMNCLKQGNSLKKVVFASSYLIYDPRLYQFPAQQSDVSILSENDQIYPRNTCGGAKLFHELELRFLSQFLKGRVSFTSARIFRVYGYHSRDVISRWIRAALRGEKLMVFRPEGQFDYVFADDVAEALLRLAKTNHSGVVNVGSGVSQSVQSFIDLLHSHFPKLQTEYVESNIPFEHSQADIRKLEEWINWRPTHSLAQALPKLIEFEKRALQLPAQELDHSAVLITSISKKMPLIEAVRKAADKIGQFKTIHGCDSDPDCIGQYGVDEFWLCPPLKELTVEEVIDYCQRNHIEAIIPTRDADLDFYARHAPALLAQGIHVMCSSLEAVTTCLDKKQFADFLTKHHFPVIPTALSPDNIRASLFVVKERRGAGSQKIGFKLAKEEAIQWGQSLKEAIFQSFIEGKEWSVDVYRSKEGRVKGCVARLRDYVVGGESQVTTTVSYPALEHLCQDMADRLNVYGHVIFQIIEDDQGLFHVIECNPRFGGASTASLAAGLDSFFWFFIECLGLSLQSYPFRRRNGEIRQIRYVTDRMIPWSSYLT
ncbi:NAD dependent epimerase/dehydratase family protein [Candidatus Protochlamydia naegleriophila]|uniref:NAD dependent epimerase/dehydratase family protein n=1 Tax=Candidatus Protochlamydia naegleriophila TaxID=389348 RepID=A0A0U5JC03_9BACT|nr:NAD-dependent epimerase/dehydratase family protein [Candidatus Protochlamydia naegleriophila]CUI16637.1 NAD dependent epimerase/dehydratase family protein [Candidatus Protochlamydia naegleriophila]